MTVTRGGWGRGSKIRKVCGRHIWRPPFKDSTVVSADNGEKKTAESGLRAIANARARPDPEWWQQFKLISVKVTVSQAVSQAVGQTVSQAVRQAVSQAVQTREHEREVVIVDIVSPATMMHGFATLGRKKSSQPKCKGLHSKGTFPKFIRTSEDMRVLNHKIGCQKKFDAF